MKIETKLSFINIKKNIKRTIFTTISIMICSFLIFTTMLVISSIYNSISENMESEYNDYHFIIKNISLDQLNQIKDKSYIDKIYIQEATQNESQDIEKLSDTFYTKNNINAYIKYSNIKKTCTYSIDIIQTLDFSLITASQNCSFNKSLLAVYGLIDCSVTQDSTGAIICRCSTNFSYIIDLTIILVLSFFSILSIIILYNSFLITINERKKDYSTFNSIGGTEGQILKMIFAESTTIGIIGIILGGFISFFTTNIILNMLNNILAPTSYNFKLVVDIKYVILSLVIIFINIYMSAIIPSIKASTSSVIQNIRNNKQIKHRRRTSFFEKFLPIEGKMAFKNLKRNRSKYRIITFLLIICMTSYIAISTYINYEKEASKLVNPYSVDADLFFMPNIDYKSILNNYITTSGNQLEYMEHAFSGIFVLVEPQEAIVQNVSVNKLSDDKIFTYVSLVGLDDTTYNSYINKLHANYGDFIIYNTITTIEDTDTSENSFVYHTVFKRNYNLNFSVIKHINESNYEIIDNDTLSGNYILTNELIEFYRDYSERPFVLIFTNMEMYNKINKNITNYIGHNESRVHYTYWGIPSDTNHIRVICDNIIDFSNYIEDINEKQNVNISAEYYSLDNQEKIIYINILQLILEIIILTIVTIGIISSINIINASLCERKQEFTTLYSLGATNKNINRILIYECVFVFIKAMIISIILSIPILCNIIDYTKNLMILNKLLIPFADIGIFLLLLFIISLFITLYSTRFIKDK